MKKNISFMILIAVSGILIGSESPKRVRFSSDVTIAVSPIVMRATSGSDASADALSGSSSARSPIFQDASPAALYVLGSYYSKPRISSPAVLVDEKPLQASLATCTNEPYDIFTGRFGGLSPEVERDIKHQVTKDQLLQNASFRKKFLAFLGCTPRITPKK